MEKPDDLNKFNSDDRDERIDQLRLQFRVAGLEDTELITRLHIESWRSAYQGMLPREYLQDRLAQDRLEHWQNRLPYLLAAGGAVVIAERNQETAGFVCVELPDQEQSVLVDNLHARPHLKRTGIGTALLDYATGWASTRAARALHLFVLEPNLAARRFYAAQGWREICTSGDVMAGIDIVHLRLQYLLPGPRGSASTQGTPFAEGS